MSDFLTVLLVMAGCVVGTTVFFLIALLINERISTIRRSTYQNAAEEYWDVIETKQMRQS